MEKVHVWIALHQDEKKERLNSEAEIRKMREELLHQAKQNERLATLQEIMPCIAWQLPST
ncbi:hypothetical protein V6Z12_A01G177300 [Gossypium hirsutum]